MTVAGAATDSWKQNLEQNPDDRLSGPRPESWWTGRRPGDTPGEDEHGVLRSLPMPRSDALTRDALKDYFDNTWALTERLFAGLQGPEAFFRPPVHRLRHPLIFYYGHVAVFYVNKLRVAGLHDRPVRPDFEDHFEVGVDEMSWDDMSLGDKLWPSVAAVTEYRREVHALVHEIIDALFADTDTLAVGWDDPAWALLMALEHERIHIETSSVLMRELPVELLRRPEGWPDDHPGRPAEAVREPEAGRDYPAPELVSLDGGTVVIGKPKDWSSYGWDNEYGRREQTVKPFEARKTLVTNGDFLEFVKDGGYRDEQWWSEDGWSWRRHRNRKWPIFWEPDGPENLHHYQLRTVFAVRVMPWSWPVVVNFHEARAYARWLSAKETADETTGDDSAAPAWRLATEAEHWIMRGEPGADGPADPERDLVRRSGESLHREPTANLMLAHGSEGPADASLPSPAGVHDARGNLWVWCEDHQHMLPGSEVHPFYDDFTTPCCMGEHQMIHGGSFISTGDEASLWARYQFRPHFFQHAGFRLVRSAADPTGSPFLIGGEGGAEVVYESDREVSEYLSFHYAEPADAMPYEVIPKGLTDFPKRLAARLIEQAEQHGVTIDRALDVGCAVGATSFALGRVCKEVVGVDLSKAFIQAASHLAEHGEMDYRLKVEGEVHDRRTVRIDLSALAGKVSFRRGDACALPADLANFDAVVVANLLCRVPSPRAVIGRLRSLVRPGGILLVSSPYTWMEQFTPKGAWLGGREADGDKPRRRSREEFMALMAPDFELKHEEDMPMIIREHVRKYQLGFPHVTVWIRKGG